MCKILLVLGFIGVLVAPIYTTMRNNQQGKFHLGDLVYTNMDKTCYGIIQDKKQDDGTTIYLVPEIKCGIFLVRGGWYRQVELRLKY